jgi:hypothetical protein
MNLTLRFIWNSFKEVMLERTSPKNSPKPGYEKPESKADPS